MRSRGIVFQRNPNRAARSTTLAFAVASTLRKGARVIERRSRLELGYPFQERIDLRRDVVGERFADHIGKCRHIGLVPPPRDKIGVRTNGLLRLQSSSLDFTAVIFLIEQRSRREIGGHVDAYGFKGPKDFPERRQLKTFHPIMRCSKRMIEAYVNEVLSGEWEGHTESLLASIAVYRGFAIEDLGRGEVYTNSALDRHLSPGTFVWLPWKRAYYHEEPNGFERGFLHHPIKPDPSFAKRVTSHLLRMAHFARLLP